VVDLPSPLFDEANTSPFQHANFASRKDLQDRPLPLFWYWVDKVYMPEEEMSVVEINTPV